MKDKQNIEDFSSSLEGDKQMEHFFALARMNKKRKETVCPDIDKAWRTFKQENDTTMIRKKDLKIRLWGAALAGAAAMLIGVLSYTYLYNDHASPNAIVTMVYDETPQNILLQEDSLIFNLSDKDSISFQQIQSQQPTTVSLTPAKKMTSSESRPVKTQKLSTPRGMDFKVILPDGSEVWLNAESTIEFPVAFSDNKREVALKGEAYFKIARNEESPFIVTSDRMKVRVLGTEFNFKSYATEAPHVSLIQGSVEILRLDNTLPEMILKPGQDASFDENGNIRVREIDTYAVTQWVNGFFYFDGLPLVDILRELGRWYNLGVIFRNPNIMQQKIHFSASRNENINQAVENLNRLRKAKIEIENNNLVVY